MTKLEQVARAIIPGAFDSLPGHGEGECPDCDYNRKIARQYARAAVEALREPSAHMISEGYDHFEHGGSEAVWPAMVDAILSEKPDAH